MAGMPCRSNTRLIKVIQGRPDDSTWKLWQKACLLFSNKDGTLFQGLGQWLLPADKLRRTWPAYLHPTTKQLYLSQQDHFECHHRLSSGSPRAYSFTSRVRVEELPTGCTPIDITSPNARGWVTGKQSTLVQTAIAPPPTTFEDYVEQLPQWERERS